MVKKCPVCGSEEFKHVFGGFTRTYQCEHGHTWTERKDCKKCFFYCTETLCAVFGIYHPPVEKCKYYEAIK